MSKTWELRTITHIEAAKNFQLICTFDNGVTKTFDLRPLLKKGGSMIKQLESPAFFKKVFLEMGTPTWPNGFDLCCDVIYQQGKTMRAARKKAA
jgi:hypothetical protein